VAPGGPRRWLVAPASRLVTGATWVHTHQPFPLGHPMVAIKLAGLGTGLEVERALIAAERRRLLDAADLLLAIGGCSTDRKRYKTGERPRRMAIARIATAPSPIPSSKRGCAWPR